jgi:uncharacterized membrane protein YjjP (DUF1212 family)
MVIGPLYIYITTYLRGASLLERLLATMIIPFLWMTKGVIELASSHPISESLYWYFNPLYLWMICLLAVEIGIGTMIARYWLKRRGEPIKVITAGPVLVFVGGLTIFIAMFAWGQGENIYVLFLKGYRLIFGNGA